MSLHCPRETGLMENQILDEHSQAPRDHSELALVQTDDTVFAHTCRHRGAARLRALDAAMAAEGVQRKN